MLQNPLYSLANHDEYQKTLSGIGHYSKLYCKTKIMSAHEKGYKDEARAAYLKLAELKDKRRQFETSELPILIRVNYFRAPFGPRYRVYYYLPEIDAVVYDLFDGKKFIVLREHTLDITKSYRCDDKSINEIVADIRNFIAKRFSKRDYKDWKELRKSLYWHFFHT